jgi:hypothetical protein
LFYISCGKWEAIDSQIKPQENQSVNLPIKENLWKIAILSASHRKNVGGEGEDTNKPSIRVGTVAGASKKMGARFCSGKF